MSTVNGSSSSVVIAFAKTTQNVCICLGISILLIIVFMMTPLNTILLSSVISKIIILILLGYTLYYNTTKTQQFASQFNVTLTNGDWNSVKTNVVCSYIFSVFLLMLILSVIRNFF